MQMKTQGIVDLPDGKAKLSTIFNWNESTPWEVECQLMQNDEVTKWCFGIDLLREGLHTNEPVGFGDVKTWTDSDGFCLYLGMDTFIIIEYPIKDIAQFVDKIPEVDVQITDEQIFSAFFSDDNA